MANDDRPADEPDLPTGPAFDEPGDPVDGLGDLLGGLGGADGGGLDFGGLLQSAMDMQQQLAAAQAELASTVVTGRAGGGAVEIDVTGGLEFLAVRITPAAVDPDDVEMLQDLVLAALHDATRSIGELQQASTPDLGGLPGMGGFGGDDPLAALGLGVGPVDDEDGDEDDG